MDRGTGLVVSRFVDVFGRLVTVTAATKRLLKLCGLTTRRSFCGGLMVSSTGFLLGKRGAKRCCGLFGISSVEGGTGLVVPRFVDTLGDW